MHSTSHWQLWLLVNLGWVAPVVLVAALALVGAIVLIWWRKSYFASQPDTEKKR